MEAFRQEFNQKVKRTSQADHDRDPGQDLRGRLARTFPQFNSSLDLASKELVLKQYVHIGVAVDTPGGLLVPVLRDADGKGIESSGGRS